MVLVLYGILTYIFFFYEQENDTKKILSAYETNIMELEQVRLKEKLNSLVAFINYHEEQSSSQMMQGIKQKDTASIYLTDKLYNKDKSKKSDKKILEYIKSHANFYNGYFLIVDKSGKTIYSPNKNNKLLLQNYDNIGVNIRHNKIIYTRYLSEYQWYIIAIRDLTDIKKSIEKKKEDSLQKLQDNMKTNIYILLITWVVSLMLSLYLSYIINRLLKGYKDKLEQRNEQLIFQSRQAILGELLSMIAHQWRQPINKIASIVALIRFDLKSEKIDSKEIDSRCENIENHIEFMSETIDNFRTFYKPKKDEELANLKSIVLQAISFLDEAIVKKSIKVTTDLEDIQYRLYANEFLQVILNLIKNAIDAIEKDGEINIYLQKDKNILLIIEDNGIGIQKEDLKHIFEPYFTTKKESMGLGLYMSKMILERHIGATITVETLKKGTRFTIVL